MVPVLQATNFGWSEREANREFTDPNDCSTPPSNPPEGMTDPVVVYDHEDGRCSISGGLYMDWGPEAIQNGYMYGDFCTGEIWMIEETNQDQWQGNLMLDTEAMLVGFGRGLNDELLLFRLGGSIFELDVSVS